MIDLFDFTLRYEHTLFAKYHARPLTLLQQEIMYRCDGRVTVADLADATLEPHPEIRAALSFLMQHGLVRTLPPDPRLFDALPHQTPAPPAARPPARSRRSIWRCLKTVAGQALAV